jgi:Ca2+-binding EF-hand superfamily protein
MKRYWITALPWFAALALLAGEAFAQRTQQQDAYSHRSRSTESSSYRRDDVSPQYGNDQQRTSRDYAKDAQNDFDDERSTSSNPWGPETRPFYPRDERDFDRDNNDAPHSSTRTDRSNRFDRAISRFEEDQHRGRSYDPSGGSAQARMGRNSRHDDPNGGGSRSRSSGESQGAMRPWESENEQNFAESARDFVHQYDEDDDGYLSRRELPLSMREHFHDLDRDGDDYLSRSELERHSARLLSAVRQHAMQSSGNSGRIFQVAPVDVTYEWVVDADSGQVNLEDLQNAYEVLRQIDQNGDGRITRSELRDRREQIVSTWIDHSFEQFDEDGDGAITQQEANQTLLQERFDRLDRNGDAELTRGELRRSVETASEHWGPQDQGTQVSQDPDERGRR